MKIKMLLPNKYKLLGWCLVLPSFIMMMLYLYLDIDIPFLDYSSGKTDNLFNGATLFNISTTNFTDEIAGVLLIAGLLLVAFSREKTEDERTIKLRLESLLWAVLVNSILVILAIILIYGTLFLQVMVYNICTPLIIFIARFNYVMYRERKTLKNEEAV
ncbi:MAG TPA: hypothetical protein VHB48_03425 [Chitinophagaceae bacterium]|nr:hypothetical protein [Chitinophagaceae bacterium]